MIKIQQVAYTVMPVTDIVRARSFYEETLGLMPGKTFSGSAGQWVEYDLGPTTLSITSMIDADWQPSKNGAAVALEVTDFDNAMTWLKSRDVSFQTEPHAGAHCRMATIYDPDGNCLALHWLKPVST